MILKDIAEKAGVSMMTVSNVINGKHNRVSPKTAERITKIIEECNYVPNLTARSLTVKSSHIIGIIVPIGEKRDGVNYFDNPYVSTMVGIIETILNDNGYYAMIRSAYGLDDVITLLKNWNVDGVIFLHPLFTPNFSLILNDILKKHPLPIVIFDRFVDNPNIISITTDDQKGSYLSTKYLINHGHTRIAFVADYEDNPILTARLDGYKQALRERDILVKDEYIFSYPVDYENCISAGHAIADSNLGITGVVTTADICAIGIMEGARLGGLRVPTDLSVIGFDNLKLCSYTTPKLTTVSQHTTRKATLAATLLLEKIQTGSVANNHIEMDVEIVERQSVALLT